jgi:hypothetical protein
MAFMDETWIWRFHCKKKGIGPADALINGSKTRKGKRLIVIDAMTADGQLSHWDEDGILQSTAHQNWEYAEDGDYHEAMDHNHFMSWVEDFLFQHLKRNIQTRNVFSSLIMHPITSLNTSIL